MLISDNYDTNLKYNFLINFDVQNHKFSESTNFPNKEHLLRKQLKISMMQISRQINNLKKNQKCCNSQKYINLYQNLIHIYLKQTEVSIKIDNMSNLEQITIQEDQMEPCNLIFQNIIGNFQKGNLYLGGIEALSEENLKKLGVRSIITLIPHNPSFEAQFKKFYEDQIVSNFLWIIIKDHPQAKISETFQKAHQFIAQHLIHGNVLVHCCQGISRSPTIIISFLMNKFKFSFKKAKKIVENKRSFINPNQGFEQQLQRYEEQLQILSMIPFNHKLTNQCKLFDSEIYQQILYCTHIYNFSVPQNNKHGNLFIGNSSSIQKNIREYFSITFWLQLQPINDPQKSEDIELQFQINRKKENQEEQKFLKINQKLLLQLYRSLIGNLEHGNILIQCEDGIQYSPIFAGAFLSFYLNISLQECLKYIQTKKPIAKFPQKLKQYLHQKNNLLLKSKISN